MDYDKSIDISALLDRPYKCQECHDLGGWFEAPDGGPVWKAVAKNQQIWVACDKCGGKPLPEANNYSSLMGIRTCRTKPINTTQEQTSEPDIKTSYGRFQLRAEKFKDDGEVLGGIRHYGWWLLHNVVAHLGIGVFPTKPTFAFHDWTSHKLNHN